MNRRRHLFYIAVLLRLGSAVCVGACQGRRLVQLSDGLVKQFDLAGQWQWSNSSLTLVAPGYSRYKNVPAIEAAEIRLKGRYASDNRSVKIFHLLLHCDDSCPSLGDLNLTNDLDEAGGETFSLNLQNTGQFADAQCLRTTASSLPFTACAVEVRYSHIISRLTLYINGEMSKEEIERILNEMLLQVDKRLQEIDLHFGEETF